MSSTTTIPRRPASLMRRVAATLLAAVTLSVAVACSSDDGEDAATATGDGDGNFPVTMEHVYGETVIPAKPEKIVTVGWMTHDIVAVLGVAPVGVDRTWGGDDEGFSPWFRHQVEDVIGGDMPEITNKDDGTLDIEEIATLEPDLILAPHSGVTDDEYAKLSRIAPTVAYQKSPWMSGSWQDLTGVVAKALGEEGRVADLVSGTEDAMATEAAKYPNLKGASFLYGLTFEGNGPEVGLYVSDDPRVAFLREFGLVDSPNLAKELGLDKPDDFSGAVSLESIGKLDADLFVAWSSGPDYTENTLENPAMARWSPIRDGRYCILENEALAMATNAPSPLSIRWALDEGFLADLSEAVDGGAVVRANS
ncbi:ABC transporter substrate-binding protein [uncultured Corynebacterium sp.]|uniref:ABC transporter substrate-binding protein n=1 Tax=uncultured Corynebacterium sp. TaxID=159447 RepID=UPI00259474A7|nr:ABC transporter substrate-binding protein [uncultured Corynebacterium sp.]